MIFRRNILYQKWWYWDVLRQRLICIQNTYPGDKKKTKQGDVLQASDREKVILMSFDTNLEMCQKIKNGQKIKMCFFYLLGEIKRCSKRHLRDKNSRCAFFIFWEKSKDVPKDILETKTKNVLFLSFWRNQKIFKKTCKKQKISSPSVTQTLKLIRNL